MNTNEIRKWGEEVGGNRPMAYTGLENRSRAEALAEGVHHDNFGLAILQIQATLEVAAQVAELRAKLDGITSDDCLDVFLQGK